MKKLIFGALAVLFGIGALSSCNTGPGSDRDEFIEVIGEYEQTAPEAGFRLNLSYNGPLDMREKFSVWADSVQRQNPNMIRMNENIFLNYMPEQMNAKINRTMFQTSVTYTLTVPDSAAYQQLANDLLARKLPFNLNVTSTFLDPAMKLNLQKEMMQKALENARSKIEYLRDEPDRNYTIVGIEEVDTTMPYGAEYFEFNRKMMMRLKVKARLL